MQAGELYYRLIKLIFIYEDFLLGFYYFIIRPGHHVVLIPPATFHSLSHAELQ